jgi:hypothetical protein
MEIATVLIQGAPRGNVSILEGHIQAKISVYGRVPYSEQFPEIWLFHCTDEQHAMSSHELQSALMLTMEFSEVDYTK